MSTECQRGEHHLINKGTQFCYSSTCDSKWQHLNLIELVAARTPSFKERINQSQKSIQVKCLVAAESKLVKN